MFQCLSILLCPAGVCGDWPEEQWDAFNSDLPRPALSLSYPDLQPGCGVAVQPVVVVVVVDTHCLGPFDCDKIELCVRCYVWQTPFSFELLKNRYMRDTPGW